MTISYTVMSIVFIVYMCLGVLCCSCGAKWALWGRLVLVSFLVLALVYIGYWWLGLIEVLIVFLTATRDSPPSSDDQSRIASEPKSI